MKFISALATGASLVSSTLPAFAWQSEVLFQHKNWKVELVGYEDGGLGCQASVGDANELFSIWTFQNGEVQLQFFSQTWAFGEGQSADLVVQIDKLSPWNLNDAELRLNSVLFTLPTDGDAAVEFVKEIARGNRLFLRNADGEDVQAYSLSGSKASIDALIECGNVITQQGPSNPFK